MNTTIPDFTDAELKLVSAPCLSATGNWFHCSWQTENCSLMRYLKS
jgi:hypothetical protein